MLPRERGAPKVRVRYRSCGWATEETGRLGGEGLLFSQDLIPCGPSGAAIQVTR